MPYDTLPHNSTLDDRWSRYRTRAHPEALVDYWFWWALFAGVAAVLNVFIITFILAKQHLRNKSFNKYVISLAFPDGFFSSCCTVSCLLNHLNGEWYGKSLWCDIQGFYVVFGITASIWMNLIIAHEIHNLARCASKQDSYVPPSPQRVFKQISAVYLFAAVWATLPIFPAFPVHNNAGFGLACLPADHDLPSLLFLWTVYLPALLAVPVLGVTWHFWRTWRHLLKQHSLGEASTLLAVFGRMFATLLCLWIPTGLLLWVFSPYVPPSVGFVAGTMSHMQGCVNVILYCTKDDIKRSLRNSIRKYKDTSNREDDNSLPPFRDRDDAPVHTHSSEMRSLFHSHSVELAGECSMTSRPSTPEELSVALAQMRARAILEIRMTERAPMTVVPYCDFVAHGRVPRSDDRLQRPLNEEEDSVVFVSHRWWGIASIDGNGMTTGCPDNEKHLKFQILCRALRTLIRRFKLEASKVAIWMDFSCIEQDDPELLVMGVQSLLSYATRSHFIVIPVYPEPEAIIRFTDAKHPMDLLNYGERAWCRLEAYVFLCLGEITGDAFSCFGYGAHFRCQPKAVIPEELQATGRTARFGCLTTSMERLKPLSRGAAAMFTVSQLPSSGQLTVEHDRSMIRDIEGQIQDTYCTFVILRAILEQVSSNSAMPTEFYLEAKQLRCLQMPRLVSELHVGPSKLQILGLRGNQIAWNGMIIIFSTFVCVPEGRDLRCLDLSDNIIEPPGPADLDAESTDPNPKVPREREILKKLNFHEPQPYSCIDDIRTEFDHTEQAECHINKLRLLLDKTLGSKECHLKILQLSGNPLRHMAHIFVSAGRKLKKLELARCSVGCDGAAAIAEVLNEGADLVDHRCTQRFDRRIDLESNDIDDLASQMLLSAAEVARVTVGLSGNKASRRTFGKSVLLESQAVV